MHEYSPNDWISEIQFFDDTLVHSFQFGLRTEQVPNELAEPPHTGILVKFGEAAGYVRRHRQGLVRDVRRAQIRKQNVLSAIPS